MKHLLAAAALYAGLVADVASGDGVLGGWAPACLLLVGIVAGRVPGGLLWAAAAGLLCDCVTGRPIGVTAFAAGMTVALLRAIRPSTGGALTGATEVFAAVAVIEVAAGAVSTIGEQDTSIGTVLLDPLRVAIATALLMFVGRVLLGAGRQTMGRITGSAGRASRFTEPPRA